MKADGISAYPHKFQCTGSIPQFVKQFEGLLEKEVKKDITIALAGRVFRQHSAGTKLFFYDIRGDAGQVQIFCDKRFLRFVKLIAYL